MDYASASDDLVPLVFFPAIFVPAIFVPAIFVPAILFRQSCSDDSSQQIPYHGGAALSPASRPAVSYQPVACGLRFCDSARRHVR
jgi:hypothetical protein